MMPEVNHSQNAAEAPVRMQWGVRIPLRDGIHLNATLYLPGNVKRPSPAIFTLTPYIGQAYHEEGMYFAAHGFPFLTVDVRGRGNSEGNFFPFINEARDGFDVVEWLALQSYCNGQVTMWGGSYGGYVQWATAKEFPPHLATIVPLASPYMGVDFPIRNNSCAPYLMQWLTLIAGRTSQDKIFWNSERFWPTVFREWFKSGTPFTALDAFVGHPSPVFQEWVSHPQQDVYWDRYNPTPQQCARMSIPTLTITGIYDADQPGALLHFRELLKHIASGERTRHYLVIGPWDHAGTRAPKSEFRGLTVGRASLVDLRELHLQWYAWTMQGGPKPQFLRQNVAYYVMGAEKWRHAATLESATGRVVSLYLNSTGNPTDVFASGALDREVPLGGSEPDHYVYDPADIGHADFESAVDPESLTDQRMVHALSGQQLIYHSAPFEQDTEISGFFKLSAWLSIDQPDTDFGAWIYQIDVAGNSIRLAYDLIRARYRQSLREAELVKTKDPLRYDFERFDFISRVIRKGSRLRLVIGPIHSIYLQKNYNSGGVVAEESAKSGRAVVVKLFHDASRPSALYVPFGQPET
jgi:putative CocE/NonD family hydrolase